VACRGGADGASSLGHPTTQFVKKLCLMTTKKKRRSSEGSQLWGASNDPVLQNKVCQQKYGQ